MRIAICDDEPVCLGQAVSVAEECIKDRKDKKLTLHTFSASDDLFEQAEKTGGFDIYVLDVVMPGMNGIKLGKKLRDAGHNGKIIYLTSSEEGHGFGTHSIVSFCNKIGGHYNFSEEDGYFTVILNF